MSAAAPVYDAQGKVIGAFYLLIRPEKDFTRILEIARLGDSGDTYAFDSDGLMLSDSRHDTQLKATGLIPDSPEVRSILRVQVRDPGGDMTRGYQPDTPLNERPLTRLVAAAVADSDGTRCRQRRLARERGPPVQHRVHARRPAEVRPQLARGRQLWVRARGMGLPRRAGWRCLGMARLGVHYQC